MKFVLFVAMLIMIIMMEFITMLYYYNKVQKQDKMISEMTQKLTEKAYKDGSNNALFFVEGNPHNVILNN